MSHSSFIPGWLVLLLQVKPNIHRILYMGYVFATTAPSFTSTFASALYQVQYCLSSWWIQTSNRREVTWTCLKCPNKCSRCWEAWVIFINFPPKSWLCSVHAEYVSPVNQKLVEGFLLRLHDLSRGTSEALLLLCGFFKYTKLQISLHCNKAVIDRRLRSQCCHLVLWRMHGKCWHYLTSK